MPRKGAGSAAGAMASQPQVGWPGLSMKRENDQDDSTPRSSQGVFERAAAASRLR
jgi:hypothetical protein